MGKQREKLRFRPPPRSESEGARRCRQEEQIAAIELLARGEMVYRNW